jgi:hypothetical protein
MNQKSILHAAKRCVTVLILLALPVFAWAAEAQLPSSSYTPEELAKVREWEKTWVGKKVDASSIDQVAQFLPEGFVGIFKDQATWFAPPEGFSFLVSAYKPAGVTPGTIEATKKWAPLVKTDANGWITNYAEIAGVPFPNPKTGLEVAYNFECNTRGDTYHSRWASPVINPRTKSDRPADQEFTEMFFIHRVDVEPKPAYAAADNPKGYFRTELLHFYLPAEMMNSRLLQIRYIDDKKDDDAYLYYNQFRRVRRISATERCNAIDGTDQLYDDAYQWDSHVGKNTYKLIGRKEMLCPRHTDATKGVRVMGQGFPSGLNFERCNLWVVEAVSKEKGYIYSKRIWYVDPETWLIVWQETFDKNGKYWKVFGELTDDIKNANGDMRNFFTGIVILDFIRIHAGWSVQATKELSVPTIKPNMFTTNNLQKTY